ncbi:MAG: hypothetical protein ACKPEQ_16230, partial [Dolichospermum sp.]
ITIDQSGVYSSTVGDGEGKGGNININTSNLTLKNGYITTDTYGKGDAGNIAIRATEGVNVGGFLFSGVNDKAVGNSGGITIDTST